ncbi:MAG: deoxynucleoside kinase [Clostridia bacterium]|nr:deoxynucleoside kinase [Clostridia bacterium]
MSKGKIIVIEGACDGIGKSTQYSLLKEKLGDRVITHHFPSYDSYQGKGVEKYLKGNYGDVKELSPYFVNNLYAYDRGVTWQTKLKDKYEEGYTILLDRYTTSSIIYQSCLIEDLEDRKKFIDYVVDYEYNKLQIGKPDEVIFLTAPFDIVTKLRNERKVNDGVQNDIHEKDLDFMKKVYDNAVFVADYLDWNIINCVEDEKFKEKEEIHKDICKKLML